jgi:hypothetical protein
MEKESKMKNTPTKEVKGLRWEPRWISAMGCLHPCAKHLGRDLSWPWLYGGSGYAFILNIHQGLCPSGWHVLDFPLGELGKNLGIEVDSFCEGGHEFPNEQDLPRRQREVWEATRQALEQERPCYGYNLEIGDYYVVYGYDDVGYYYSGPMCDAGKGPLPWEEYGPSGQVSGLLCLGAVKLREPADEAKTVRDALRFAIEHARSSNLPEDLYWAGLEGYDRWIQALESRQASEWGVPYNTVCYLECREHAVGFLREAQERLGGDLAPLLEEAIGPYQAVVDHLKAVAEAFLTRDPKPEHLRDQERILRATEALKQAQQSETQGVAALEKVVAALSSPDSEW